MQHLLTDVQYALKQLREFGDMGRAIAALERVEERLGQPEQAVLLESNHGQEYAKVLLVPSGLTPDECLQLASEVVQQTRRKDPENYSEEDMAKVAEEKGCHMPVVWIGPQWD